MWSACSDCARAMSCREQREGGREARAWGNTPRLCVWELWFEAVLPEALLVSRVPTSAHAREPGVDPRCVSVAGKVILWCWQCGSISKK